MNNTRLSFSIDLADGERANYDGDSISECAAAFPAEETEIRALSVGFYTETDAGEHRALSGNKSLANEESRLAAEAVSATASAGARAPGYMPRVPGESSGYEPIVTAQGIIDHFAADCRNWLTENA